MFSSAYAVCDVEQGLFMTSSGSHYNLDFSCPLQPVGLYGTPSAPCFRVYNIVLPVYTPCANADLHLSELALNSLCWPPGCGT